MIIYNLIPYKSRLLTIFLILFCFSLAAQSADTAFVKTTQLTGPFEFFVTDKLQNIYAVTTTNEVIKYNQNGEEQFRFNNNYLGDLALIDATDPFNLLLFYPDFQTAITLDRTLSPTNQVSLFDLNLINVKVIATSNDNNLWLYDEVNFQLKKIAKNGKVLSSSEDINLLLGQAPSPIQMQARDNFVYLNDPNLGIIVFDNFGQYHKTLPIKGAETFQILDQRLIYRSKEGLFVFNQVMFQQRLLQIPNNSLAAKAIQIQKNTLYVLAPQGTIEVYKF